MVKEIVELKHGDPSEKFAEMVTKGIDFLADPALHVKPYSIYAQIENVFNQIEEISNAFPAFWEHLKDDIKEINTNKYKKAEIPGRSEEHT